MRRIWRGLAIFLLIAVLVFAGDYISARFRIPGNRETLATVQVQILWAVPQKDGRIEYTLGDTDTETCIRALFPQLGYTPCWYLEKHTHKVIKVSRVLLKSNRRPV